MAGLIGLESNKREIVLTGGETDTVELTVTNGGYVVDAFDLSVPQLSADWYTLTPARISLFPNAKATATLQLHPSAEMMSLAGDYDFAVVAISRDTPGETTELPMRLTLLAVGDLMLDMAPQRVVGRQGNYRLILTNDGNKARSVVLRPSDAEERLLFTFGAAEAVPVSEAEAERRATLTGDVPSSVSVGRSVGDAGLITANLDTQATPPGAEAPQGTFEFTMPPATRVTAPLNVRSKKRIWVGSGREMPLAFEVAATPPGIGWEEREARRIQGELIYPPIFGWMAGMPLGLRRILLLAIPLLLLALILYLLLRPTNAQTNGGIPTVVAGGNSATQTALADAAAQTQTALALANLNSATQTALAAGAAAAAQTQTAQAVAAAAAQTQTAQAIAGGNSATQTALAAANQTGTAVAAGRTATAQALGITGPVEIVSFDWTDTSPAGDIITASWEVKNSITVTLNLTPVPRVGAQGYSTGASQSIDLAATDGLQTKRKSLGKLVVPAPVIRTFTGNPTTVCPGCEVTLNWEVEDASEILVDGSLVSNAPTGSATVRPTQTTEFLLTARSISGSDERIVTIIVDPNLPTPTP